MARRKDQLGLFELPSASEELATEPKARGADAPLRAKKTPNREVKVPPKPIVPPSPPVQAAKEQYLFPPEKGPPKDMSFSRRMSDLVRRLQLLERQAKADLDLTLPQSHALFALMDAGSLRMQTLAANLGLAQSTVTRLVAPLKRMGFLDRRPDRSDGRATRAFLTERGTEVVDALEQRDRQLYLNILSRLPDTRRAEVVAAIELLHHVVWEAGQDEG